MLEEKEVIRVLDSTKVQDYMNCPRYFFLRHVLGWRRSEENVNLIFGMLWHEAMDLIQSNGYTPKNGYDPQIANEACAKFVKSYREYFPPEDDPINEPKIPSNAIRALLKYIEFYKNDSFEVMHTEVAGTVILGSSVDDVLYFKIDTICKGNEGIFCLEHKTSKYFNSNWADQWRLKFQVGTYSHALFSMYNPSDVFGVKINGAFIVNPPKLKKDGTPYANSKDIEFHRVPVRKTTDSMQGWLITAISWVDEINQNIDTLFGMMNNMVSYEFLPIFRQNGEHCVTYGRCPYYDICTIKHNPLRYANNPPDGFVIDYWDPRSELMKAKERVEL